MNTSSPRTGDGVNTKADHVPRKVLIAAWTIPLMVVGQFSFLAIIPVTVVVTTVTRRFRSGALRNWSLALGAAFIAPLATWALRPDRAQSLSKDMHPSFAALIIATAAGVIGAAHRQRRH